MGYSMAHKLRNDPFAGCTAVRKKKYSSEKMTQMFKFMDTCWEILDKGQTTTGQDECKQDGECYTGHCEKAYGQDTKTCRRPMEDFETPFAACAIDNMV